MSPFFAASQISIFGSGTVSTVCSGCSTGATSSEELDDSPDEQKLIKSKRDNINNFFIGIYGNTLLLIFHTKK
jgi:hypothetical protein